MTSSASFVLLLCFGFASAAVWIEYQKIQPGKAPFCTDKVEGKKRVGDVWQDQKECILKRCLTDSQGTPLISYAGCGVVSVPSDAPCRIVTPEGNNTYPDCCPTVKCGED